MLHILWLILKFILIVLGVFLGVLLLAVLLVLFCPVRYRAEIKKEGMNSLREMKVSGSVSWLFHLLLWEGSCEDGVFRQRIRILGIPLDTLQKIFCRKSKNRKEGSSVAEKQHGSEGETDPVVSEDAGVPEISETVKEWDFSDVEEISAPELEHSKKNFASGSVHVCKQSKWEKLKHILKTPLRLWGKLKNAVRGFLGKIRKMALTIQGLYDKINWWREFGKNPKVQEAISLVWEDVKKLLRHVLPTQTEGNVIFGCEDPAVTGGILAVLGMSIPLHKNAVQITPLFEGENHLEGYAKIKGRFYGIVFLKTALEIYLNKNIKYVISRWKHKEA